MNAHIPDQLDQLSKKELLEVAQIMHQSNVDLNAQLANANERVALLEQCVIKFRQGVTHFNRTRGDLNVLLSAYADCEQLRKEQE